MSTLTQASNSIRKVGRITHVPNLQTLVAEENIAAAWEKVRANAGAAGVDGVSVESLAPRFESTWAHTRALLVAGQWQPLPLRRVTIAKPEGGSRDLGIPTVLDRVVHQALAQVLTPVFEPGFSPRSYAYRPGRGVGAAIGAARREIERGRLWVVEADVADFFSTIAHAGLLSAVAEKVADAGILNLIGRIVAAGPADGTTAAAGIPQGSPLSPLLANIALDPLDHWLAHRGVASVRYADDLRLFTTSVAEAQGALAALRTFLRERLTLSLREDKTRVIVAGASEFLGCSFVQRDGQWETAVSPNAIVAFRRQFADLHPGELDRLATWAAGWLRYYRGLKLDSDLEWLAAEARTAVRAAQWTAWATPAARQQALLARGLPVTAAAALAAQPTPPPVESVASLHPAEPFTRSAPSRTPARPPTSRFSLPAYTSAKPPPPMPHPPTHNGHHPYPASEPSPGFHLSIGLQIPGWIATKFTLHTGLPWSPLRLVKTPPTLATPPEPCLPSSSKNPAR